MRPSARDVTVLPLFDAGATVAIEQVGQPVVIRDGVAMLERAPFALVFRLAEGAGLLINANFNPDHLERLQAGKPIAGQFPVYGVGMAEGPGNPDKSLTLVDEGYHVWTAEDADEARFDAIEPPEPDGLGKYVRAVERVTLRDLKETLRIESYPYDAIYLVIVEFEPDRAKRADSPAYKLLTLRFPTTPNSKKPPGVPHWREQEEFWYLQ
jgi:hypothetical protein